MTRREKINAALAEFDKVKDQAWTEYEKVEKEAKDDPPAETEDECST